MDFTGFKKAIREALSEPGPQGTLSWARIASTIALFAVIGWITRFYIVNHAFPSWDGPIMFFMAPYGSNKAVTAAQSLGNNPVNK